MKKIIVSVSLVAGLTITQSCRNELEVPSTQQITINDALQQYNNNNGASGFVTAVYTKFDDWSMSSFSWIGISSITSDDADKGSDAGDTGSDKDVLDNLTFNATSGSFGDEWNACYDGINRANQALYYLPLLTNADAALKNRLIGETKFLRALIYFNLVRMFGGVPIVDHIPDVSVTADKSMLLTRKSKEEVYAYIEKDLKDAISALPEKSSYSTSENWRASKGAAEGLLAKVSLYEKKYQQAIDNINALNGYSLTPNYADIFKKSGENNQESLFEIQGSGDPSSRGIDGYSNTQGARGSGGWGWGFNTPSAGLANSYEPGDTRKSATIIFAGSTLYDGRIVPATVSNPRYNYKAYSSAYTDAWATDVNIRVLRYAEMLLIKAEALNELGQTTAAVPLLNQVRNRAGLGNTLATSQNDVRLAIWKERRVELGMEHDRWFDLVRTGQAQSAMAADGKTFIVGKHELFPLPQTFINESNGLSAQNPGY